MSVALGIALSPFFTLSVIYFIAKPVERRLRKMKEGNLKQILFYTW